ncbi:MAG TPA: hypothetical protein VLL05_09245 [Terriglobales bacterium]|nr:hypothetical protein [Terriglobales bacterium]
MALVINSAMVYILAMLIKAGHVDSQGIGCLETEANNEVSPCQVNAQNLAKLALRVSSRMHSATQVGESKKNHDLASID